MSWPLPPKRESKNEYIEKRKEAGEIRKKRRVKKNEREVKRQMKTIKKRESKAKHNVTRHGEVPGREGSGENTRKCFITWPWGRQLVGWVTSREPRKCRWLCGAGVRQDIVSGPQHRPGQESTNAGSNRSLLPAHFLSSYDTPLLWIHKLFPATP